ncbi:Aste57867_25335 [Aphanomyces stellatus]|uniref:Aste57867_25335 protein n=1 Tax=Aphanomyces stellatus TaxID=120398 RepID=A0A485LU82_9STRA|nr:hypothetical protein As57867_025257 [Aphanomyces stellatus]VFU01960.1 Aste57867_25335 [Aphanomyces stellatus]
MSHPHDKRDAAITVSIVDDTFGNLSLHHTICLGLVAVWIHWHFSQSAIFMMPQHGTAISIAYGDVFSLLRAKAARDTPTLEVVDTDDSSSSSLLWVATRSKWPWAFADYDPAAPLSTLLPRGVAVARYIKEAVEAGCFVDCGNHGRVVAAKDATRNVFAVHTTTELTATLPAVLNALVGPRGAQFDVLLQHVFGDKLLDTAVHATLGVDVHGNVDPSPLPPRMATVGSFLYDDSSLFKKRWKEVQYFDYLHVHASLRAVTRVFKTIDNPTKATRDATRMQHMLFGYCIESLDVQTSSRGRVRVTFYGDFCLAPHEPTSAVRDAKALLEKLASTVPLVHRMVAHTEKRWCRACLKTFSLFRHATTCVSCSHWFCHDCVRTDCVGDAARGAAFDVRVCVLCHGIATSAPPRRGSSALELPPPPATCAKCTTRPATTTCRLCRADCCGTCCHVEQFQNHHAPDDRTIDVWICRSCTCDGSDDAEVHAAVSEASPPASPTRSLPPRPNTPHGQPPPRQTPIVLFSHRDFVETKTISIVYKHLVRISEGNERAAPDRDTDDEDASDSEANDDVPTTPACLRRSLHPERTSEPFNVDDDDSATMLSSPFDIDSPPASPAAISVLLLPPQLEYIAPPESETPPRVDADVVRAAAFLNLDSNDALDEICLHAATRLDCAYAFVNLLYKGNFMLKAVATTADAAHVPTRVPRDCPLATHSSALPLFVPDADADARFAASPLVAGKEQVRFYYGLPLVPPSGVLLGTVAVADVHPRGRLSAAQRDNLLEFAHQVMSLIVARLPPEIHDPLIGVDSTHHGQTTVVS